MALTKSHGDMLDKFVDRAFLAGIDTRWRESDGVVLFDDAIADKAWLMYMGGVADGVAGTMVAGAPVPVESFLSVSEWWDGLKPIERHDIVKLSGHLRAIVIDVEWSFLTGANRTAVEDVFQQLRVKGSVWE